MRRAPYLKQHLREKSFVRNKEKILFFVAEHFTFFLFAHTLLSVEASIEYKTTDTSSPTTATRTTHEIHSLASTV